MKLNLASILGAAALGKLHADIEEDWENLQAGPLPGCAAPAPETGGCMADWSPADVEKVLREVYPHGHKDFIPLTVEEIKLHSEKNHDYAFGGHPLGNFYRVSNILGNYPGLNLNDPAIVAMVYALKQVDAYLWMKANGYEGKIEGKTSRLQDVSVYTKLAIVIENESKGRHLTSSK